MTWLTGKMGLEQTQLCLRAPTKNYSHNEKDMSDSELYFKILMNKNIAKEKKGEVRAWKQRELRVKHF